MEQQGPPHKRAEVMFPITNSAILLLDLQDSLKISSQRSVWKIKLMSGNTVILSDNSLKSTQSYFFAPWIMVNFSENLKRNLLAYKESEDFEWPISRP
jgi:hypothetical protein